MFTIKSKPFGDELAVVIPDDENPRDWISAANPSDGGSMLLFGDDKLILADYGDEDAAHLVATDICEKYDAYLEFADPDDDWVFEVEQD